MLTKREQYYKKAATDNIPEVKADRISGDHTPARESSAEGTLAVISAPFRLAAWAVRTAAGLALKTADGARNITVTDQERRAAGNYSKRE